MEEETVVVPPGGDRQIQCRQCNAYFLFSEQEQQVFQEMGFVPPKYCPSCRKARKQEANRSEDWRETYDITCNRCGKPSTVPFKPVDGRPVYCRECLSVVRGEYSSDGSTSRGASTLSDSATRMASERELSGVGLTRMEDAERPYEELDRSVETLLDSLFSES